MSFSEQQLDKVTATWQAVAVTRGLGTAAPPESQAW